MPAWQQHHHHARSTEPRPTVSPYFQLARLGGEGAPCAPLAHAPGRSSLGDGGTPRSALRHASGRSPDGGSAGARWQHSRARVSEGNAGRSPPVADDDCAICCDALDSLTHARLDGCSHRFHFDCVFKWVARSNSCPLCKAPVREVFEVALGKRRAVHVCQDRSLADPTASQQQAAADVDANGDEVAAVLGALSDDDEIVCEECGSSENPEVLLLCDGCDMGCHTYCASPTLTEVPAEDWFCDTCSGRWRAVEPILRPSQRARQARSPGASTSARRSGGLASQPARHGPLQLAARHDPSQPRAAPRPPRQQPINLINDDDDDDGLAASRRRLDGRGARGAIVLLDDDSDGDGDAGAAARAAERGGRRASPARAPCGVDGRDARPLPAQRLLNLTVDGDGSDAADDDDETAFDAERVRARQVGGQHRRGDARAQRAHASPSPSTRARVASAPSARAPTAPASSGWRMRATSSSRSPSEPRPRGAAHGGSARIDLSEDSNPAAAWPQGQGRVQWISHSAGPPRGSGAMARATAGSSDIGNVRVGGQRPRAGRGRASAPLGFVDDDDFEDGIPNHRRARSPHRQSGIRRH